MLFAIIRYRGKLSEGRGHRATMVAKVVVGRNRGARGGTGWAGEQVAPVWPVRGRSPAQPHRPQGPRATRGTCSHVISCDKKKCAEESNQIFSLRCLTISFDRAPCILHLTRTCGDYIVYSGGDRGQIRCVQGGGPAPWSPGRWPSEARPGWLHLSMQWSGAQGGASCVDAGVMEAGGAHAT